MALSRTHEVFTAKWQTGLLLRQGAVMPATIKVFTTALVTTNNTTTAVETQLYSGSARVQPTRGAQRNQEVGGVVVQQPTRFQVDQSTTFALVPNITFVRVTACALNASLVGKVYCVSSSDESSNPIERTFEAILETNG